MTLSKRTGGTDMNWKDFFSREAIEKGRKLYLNQRVEKETESDEEVDYSVEERNRVYWVSASYENREDAWSTYCYSCETRCAHCAAVHFYIDEETAEKGKARSLPVFEETENTVSLSYRDPYVYYDLNRILEPSNISESMNQTADRYIRNKDVVLERVQRIFLSEDADAGEGFYLEGTARRIARFDGNVQVWLSKEKVERARCYECGIYGYTDTRICAHILALIKQFEPYIKDKNIGDATSRNATMMLREYFETEQAEETAASSVFHLEPRLIFGRGMLSFGFRGGQDKLYVIKNINTLIHAWKKHGVYEDSRQKTDFSVTRMENEDSEMFRMALRFAEDREFMLEDSPFSQGFEVIPLSGLRLDQFFASENGHSFPITWRERRNKKNDTITLMDGTIRPEILLESSFDSNGSFEGVRMTVSKAEILRGNDYYYLIEKDRLIRIEENAAKALNPIFRVMKECPGNTFRIGRSSMARFYHHVLPILEQYCDIKDHTNGACDAFIPPDLELTYYLDCDEDQLLATAAAAYGEEVRPMAFDVGSGLSYRDETAENRSIALLTQYFPNHELSGSVFSQVREDDAVYHILSEGLEKLADSGDVQMTDRFRNLRLKRRPNFRFGVSVNSTIMDLELLSDELTPQELLELLQSYREKKRYHRLRSGAFISLENSPELESLSEMMDTMHVSLKEFVKGRIHIPAYRALYLDRMLEEQQSFSVEKRKSYRNLISQIASYRDSDYEVPDSLKQVLRPYQEEGFRWLMALKTAGFGGVLADDMGLGKTVQMIAVLAAEKAAGNTCHSLIVCPASLVFNWAEEFRRFAPELSVQVITGTKKERRGLIEQYRTVDVSITSYDLLKRDIDLYEDAVFDYEVLDEAQFIKNPASEAAKSTKIIHSLHRFALTGTPIENRLSELWSIFDYLMSGFLYNYETFRRELETPIANAKDETATVRLRRMVSPFILRRLKENVLADLPDKLEETVYTRFENEQQKLYNGQVVKMRNDLLQSDDSDFKKARIQILAELTRLREICCDPHLLYEDYHGESAKRQALYQLLETAMDGGHRMLIFSQFASMLKIIEEDLKQKKIPCYRITGDTPKEERIRMVNAFNENEVPVFLISLKAGGTGLNLTGADVVIHYDPWWNLAAMNQATDRAHRIGQTRTVTVYRIIVKDSIEDRILKMQESKKDLADSILTGEMGGFASMSREELLDLLS